MSADLFRTALGELDDVLSRVDAASIDGACRKIADAKAIGVFGCGREALQVKGFAMRLFHLGLPVAVVGDMTMPALGAGDLFPVRSGPGETATVLTLMRLARQAGATNLMFTAEAGSSAARLADLTLLIPAQTMASDQGMKLDAADGLGLRGRAVRLVRGDGAEAEDDARRPARGDACPPYQHGMRRCATN